MNSPTALPTPLLLLQRTVSELRNALEGTQLEGLVEELVEKSDGNPLTVAFVGPQNAGKSSLIAALTRDLSIPRSARPETSSMTRHPWRTGVDLADLPGWFSGFTEHDHRASESLRREADIVVFVMTVELGDERAVDAIQYVLGTLGFGDRAIIVVNKSQTEDSEDAVILEEINDRLGSFVGIRVVQTDAQDFLDTISGEFDLDDETIAILQAGSGISDLHAVLEELCGQHLNTARFIAGIKQAARVAEEALSRTVPGEEEAVAVAALDALAHSVTRARARLMDLTESHLSRLEAEVASIAELVIKDPSLSESDLQVAWDRATAPAQRLGIDGTQILSDLERDFEGMLTSLSLGTPPSLSGEAHGLRMGPQVRAGQIRPTPRLLKAMGLDLTEGTTKLSKTAEEIAKGGSKPGSAAYELIGKLRPNKKWIPHGRTKDAEKLRKGASVASKSSLALPVIQELWQWSREIHSTREAFKAQSELREHYAELAKDERKRVISTFKDWLEGELLPFEQVIVDGRIPFESATTAREHKRQELSAILAALFALQDQFAAGAVKFV